MARKRGKKERAIIERGVSPVVGIVLLVLVTLSIGLGAWTFHTNLQRSAQEHGTAGVLSTAEKTGTQVRIADISGNQVYVQNRGVVAITRLAVYVDDRFVQPYEEAGNIYPGEMKAVSLPESLEVGTHVIKVTANGIATDTKRVEGTELSKFRWRKGVLVKNPTDGRVTSSWAGGKNGIDIKLPVVVPLESIVVFDQERREIPFESGGAWWNPDWLRRRKLTFTDSSGIQRDDIVSIRLEDLELETGNCRRELRVVDSNGKVSPMQVLAFGADVCEIEFQARVPAGGSADYYVYYKNPGADEPGSETDLKVYDDNDEVCIENSVIKTCLGKDIGAITWFGKKDGENLLTKRSGINAFYTGVQPAIAYSEGRDYSTCSPYTYEEHRIKRNGDVEIQVEYDFSTKCGSNTYRYRYTVSMFRYQPYYELTIENLNRIDFLGIGYAYVAQTMWSKQVSINSPDGQGWSAYKVGSESVGVVPIYATDRANVDTIRPTNYLKIDDSKSLPAGKISTTRTVYQGDGDPNERVGGEAKKLKSPLDFEESGEEGRPETTSLRLNFPVTLNGKESRIFYIYYTDEKLGLEPHVITNIGYANFNFEITVREEEVFRGQI